MFFLVCSKLKFPPNFTTFIHQMITFSKVENSPQRVMYRKFFHLSCSCLKWYRCVPFKVLININRFFKVFSTNSNLLIHLSLQPDDGENFGYFKLIFDSNRILSLKYQRSKPLGCNDKGLEISEFMARNQFLYYYFLNIFVQVSCIPWGLL